MGNTFRPRQKIAAVPLCVRTGGIRVTDAASFRGRIGTPLSVDHLFLIRLRATKTSSSASGFFGGFRSQSG